MIELVLLLMSLLTCGIFFPCCKSDSVEVKEPQHYSVSHAVVRPAAPVSPRRLKEYQARLEQYQAKEAIEAYKRAHPVTVATLQTTVGTEQTDKAIAKKHLRTESRHIAHAKTGMAAIAGE